MIILPLSPPLSPATGDPARYKSGGSLFEMVFELLGREHREQQAHGLYIKDEEVPLL